MRSRFTACMHVCMLDFFPIRILEVTHVQKLHGQVKTTSPIKFGHLSGPSLPVCLPACQPACQPDCDLFWHVAKISYCCHFIDILEELKSDSQPSSQLNGNEFYFGIILFPRQMTSIILPVVGKISILF